MFPTRWPRARRPLRAASGMRSARTFFEPTVLIDANAGMRLAAEETFGPVAPLFRFKEEEEAIRFANGTPYGLAAYFYSRDVGRVWRVTEELEFGMVG